MTAVCPSRRKRAYERSCSSIGSSSSKRCTSRSRNAWNGAYHSRSQCVCGTIATVVGCDDPRSAILSTRSVERVLPRSAPASGPRFRVVTDARIRRWRRAPTPGSHRAMHAARRRSRVGDPAVADAGFGEDQPRVGGIVAELAPELAHVDAQVVALAAVALPPHLAQEIVVSEKFARIPDEHLEKRELRPREVDGRPVEAHPPLHEVDLEAVALHDAGAAPGLRRASQGGADAGKELV